ALQEVDGHVFRYVAGFWHSGWSILEVTDAEHPELPRFLDGPPNTMTVQVRGTACLSVRLAPVIDVPVYPFSATALRVERDLSINFLTLGSEDRDVHTEGFASDLSDVRTRYRPGTYECSVAGISHHADVAQDPALLPGRPVRLEREPDNPYDSRAIRVMT